jgi:hypothetical protein
MIKIYFVFALMGVFYACSSESDNTKTKVEFRTDYSVEKDKDCGKRDLLMSFETQDSRIGFKKRNNQVVIPAIYKTAFQDTIFSYGIVLNNDDQMVGIDLQGKYLYNIYVFDNGPDYIEYNRFRIKKNGKVGFANGITGCIEIDPELSYAEPFHEGLTVFCLGGKLQTMGEHSIWTGGKWGVMDTLGKVIVEPIYSSIESFENGKTTALLGKKKVTIDKTGEVK